jgi:hypothetical protein
MRFLSLIAAAALVATPAFAAPCRNAKGKFIKCTDAKTATAAKHCKLHGKFAKCSTPGAKPV